MTYDTNSCIRFLVIFVYIGLHYLEFTLNIRVFDTSNPMNLSTSNAIRYTIDSEQLFKVIARHNGINLTDLVKAVNPNFDFWNTPKTAYRHAVDQLVLEGRVRYTMQTKADGTKGKKRDQYFLDCEYVETSKRVIFANFIRDLRAAL